MTGQINGIRKDKMVVSSAGVAVEVELSDKVEITLDMSDPTLARPGDEISVNGWAYNQQKQNVWANRMTITGANKLTLDSKGDRRKKPVTKSEEKGDESKESAKDAPFKPDAGAKDNKEK